MVKDSFLFNLMLSLRPKQWIKNLFIFAGIMFSQNIYNISMLTIVIYVFLLFCMLSSGVYLINDVIDIDKDKVHPIKKNRPIAAGKISKRSAITIAIIFAVASIFMAYTINVNTGIIASIYFMQTLLYSLYFKNVVILDILIISFGFVLRTIAGATAININVSVWLLVCITLVSLFLALCKRRNEIIVLNQNADNHRKILSEYTPELLNQMIGVVTSSTVIVYSLYTFLSNQSKYLMITIPFVIYGMFRYLYLVYKQESGGDPANIIIKDRPMGINISLWVVSVFLILYVYP